MGKTLAEKIWADHVVTAVDGEPDLLYIDLHLIHEVTSPQAFDGLRLSNRPVHRPDLTLATEDHNVPTLDIDKPIADPVPKLQVDTLRNNCKEFGVRIHSLGDIEQGIVHVVGPQLGLTQPLIHRFPNGETQPYHSIVTGTSQADDSITETPNDSSQTEG